MPLQLLGPNIRDWSQSKSRRSHDHSFPEGIISGRTQKWKRGLFYDFKILLVVVILAQAFHITHQLFLKFAEAWPEAEKSLTEFSVDRGVAAFKPSIKPRLNKFKFGSQWVCVIACYQGVKLQLIQTPMSVWRSCKMAHISLGNSVAGERQVRRYVGVLFAYFDFLLESFGFKTCRFGGSQL